MNFHPNGVWRSPMTALLLPIIVALTQCTRPEQDLGLSLQPEGDLLNVFQTDTVTLFAFTEVEDSLQTDELSQSLLGNTVDPVTGRIMTSFYTQVRLAAPDIDFGANPECDSIVLSLKYTGQAQGLLTPQHFGVYEISDALDQAATYTSNQDFALTGANLVDFSKQPLSIEPLKRLVVGGDSVNPQLRIPLQLAFGNRLLTAGSTVYSTNADWLEYFKGLYVYSLSVDGAVFNVDLVDVESRMRLYYHNDTDTLFYDYNINSLCARSNRFAHSFGNDAAGISSENPLDGSSRLFVQGAAALKARIDLPYIDAFSAERRVINKAELIVPLADALESRNTPIPQLFVLTENEDGQSVGLPGQLSTTIEIGGSFNVQTNQYRFNITRWFQDYLNGNQTVKRLYLVSGSAGISALRSVLAGPAADSSDPEANMRLVVTYSN